MSASRDEILRRIRATTRPSPEPVERAYRHAGNLAPAERASLFHERVSDYRADVRRIETDRVAETVAAACAEHGARRIVVPSGIPPEWKPPAVDLVDDLDLDPLALDALDGALTGCTVAIAETGTIVLSAGEVEGRRALTLVPDLHICVVRESQVVELVPEAIAAIREIVGHGRRPITFVSGPSATSDIELSRVEGVHGPRRLVVLIVKERE
jgi:L-lactate dehydrogenase complex protein LldG